MAWRWDKYSQFFIYIWRRCLCPCSIKSLFLCFSAPAEDTAIHGLLMFMSYEKGGCCLGLCLQKPKDALKGTVSHWVLATWKVYIIAASIESPRRIYASNEPCVFLALHVHLPFAGVLSHLVLQRIFRRMPMEEPPLQIQSQVPTSMPSIQRTHAVHAILNLFDPFLPVVFNIFSGQFFDHELTM